MSKRMIIFAASFAAATAMTTLGASANGWGHQSHSSGGLLGLNVNVGTGQHNALANVRANVGNSRGGLANVDATIGGVLNADVNVGGNSRSHRSSNSLLNLNANVGGSSHRDCHYCGGVGW